MTVVSMNYLLEAGVHFGHQKRRWNPKMREYIYTLTHAEQLETSIVPIGDGITLSVKKG